MLAPDDLGYAGLDVAGLPCLPELLQSPPQGVHIDVPEMAIRIFLLHPAGSSLLVLLASKQPPDQLLHLVVGVVVLEHAAVLQHLGHVDGEGVWVVWVMAVVEGGGGGVTCGHPVVQGLELSVAPQHLLSHVQAGGGHCWIEQ